MNSALLECRLLHHRIRPREHRFTNRIFFLALDLAEVDTVSRRLSLFSKNARNLYAFLDRDFLPAEGAELPLLEKVRGYLRRENMEAGTDLRVVLIAIPRVAGYLFNPVSFYFCYNGIRPLCALAEVTNTFREVKTYTIRPAHETDKFEANLPKDFYVSPFTECDGRFVFSLRYNGSQLVARIDEFERGELVVHTVVVGEERALTDRNLAWFAVKYPFLGLQVMARIHTQALRLYLKRLPWWRKSDQAQLQKNFYQPAPTNRRASPEGIKR